MMPLAAAAGIPLPAILINVVQPGCYRFSINVVSFSSNVVLRGLLFSLNLVGVG